jgi:hypothetical protein
MGQLHPRLGAVVFTAGSPDRRRRDDPGTPDSLDIDAHIAAQEARLNESLDHEEDQRTIDRARDLLDSISEPLTLLSDFERDFLSVLVDSPLDAAFARHLKPDSAAAFERFKQMGFVELAAISDRYRITNDGRRALSLPRDPHLD